MIIAPPKTLVPLKTIATKTIVALCHWGNFSQQPQLLPPP